MSYFVNAECASNRQKGVTLCGFFNFDIRYTKCDMLLLSICDIRTTIVNHPALKPIRYIQCKYMGVGLFEFSRNAGDCCRANLDVP